MEEQKPQVSKISPLKEAKARALISSGGINGKLVLEINQRKLTTIIICSHLIFYRKIKIVSAKITNANKSLRSVN